MELKNPLFSVSENWEKIFSNERVRSFYIGNTPSYVGSNP